MSQTERAAEDVGRAHLADLQERVVALEARVAALENKTSMDRLRAEHEEQRPRLSSVVETPMEKTDVAGGIHICCPGCGASEFFRPDVVAVLLHRDASCPVLLRIKAAEEVMLDTTEVHA